MTGSLNLNRRAIASWCACTLLAVPLLAACTDNAAPAPEVADRGDSRTVTVVASDTACKLSAATAPSGRLSFSVKNEGKQVTEFYLLASDGKRIVAEVENVGPGVTRELVATVAPGSYLTACKPGMTGDGIRAPFSVSDSGADLTPTGGDQSLVTKANERYAVYVQDQTDQLLTKTKTFRSLYVSGSDDRARALYPEARVHWERIEPVAESFGDLDPKMDLRAADVEEGAAWTGWHRIEKDLWPAHAQDYQKLSPAERKKYADHLVANTQDLYHRTRTVTFTVDKVANGAQGLMDEVATAKVTGEEEFWSHTDLWDFQANVDGARTAFQGLRPILKKRDPDLERLIDQRFTALQKLLDQHRTGDGFSYYDDLSKPQVKALANAVSALSEPLSQLTAAVV